MFSVNDLGCDLNLSVVSSLGGVHGGRVALLMQSRACRTHTLLHLPSRVAGGVAVGAHQGRPLLYRMHTLQVGKHVAVALLVLAAGNHGAARTQVRHGRVLAPRCWHTAVPRCRDLCRRSRVECRQRRHGLQVLDAVAHVAVTARCIRGALGRQRGGRRGDGGRGRGGGSRRWWSWWSLAQTWLWWWGVRRWWSWW